MYREQQLRSLLAGRRILIAGYGREGRSAEALLRRLLPGAPVCIADGNGQIAAESGSGHHDLIIKSPGVPMRVLRGTAAEVTSLTDLFLRVYADHTIGITGTKGKSTTASLIHHLLPGSLLAGNIGIPLFDILDRLDERSLVVAELSCHQLEVLHRSPHIAVLLNLFQEHLDHYDGYRDYQLAKLQIGLHQQEGDHLFYCTDNDDLRTLVDSEGRGTGTLHPYSLHDMTDEEGRQLEACPLAGAHNRSNALVALRVAALASGQPLAAFRPALASFRPLRHRMERVGEKGGLTWYDDSISTIPAATLAAVRALGRVDTLIVGGFDRGIDYQPLVGFLREHPIGHLVFVGKAGRRIYGELRTAGSELPDCLVEDDYGKIVTWCAAHTPPGGTVLLSPAAASYDTFKNFEERGDYFASQIRAL